MPSNQKQQDALIKSADQAEALVETISTLSEKIEKQHEDNVVSQKHMLVANCVMAAATIVMTIATVVIACKG